MTTATQKPRTRRPAARTLRLHAKPDADSPGLVTLTVRGVKTAYWLREDQEDQPGRAFEFQKFGTGEVYHVLIQQTGESSCNCPAGTSYKRCKHADGAAAMVRRGLI